MWEFDLHKAPRITEELPTSKLRMSDLRHLTLSLELLNVSYSQLDQVEICPLFLGVAWIRTIVLYIISSERYSMEKARRLQAAARLRAELRRNGQLRLEYLAAMAKLLREYGVKVEDETLANMVPADIEELYEVAAPKPAPPGGA